MLVSIWLLYPLFFFAFIGVLTLIGGIFIVVVMVSEISKGIR